MATEGEHRGQRSRAAEATVNVVAPHQDRHPQIGYDDRFLDSLAGVLMIVEPCSAVSVDRNGSMCLSFNRSLQESGATRASKYETRALEACQTLLVNEMQDTDYLIGLNLMLNKTFIKGELKNIMKIAGQGDQWGTPENNAQFCARADLLLNHCTAARADNFRDQITRGENLRLDWRMREVCIEACRSYGEMIKSLNTCGISEEAKKQLLRPLQDAVKAHHYIATHPEVKEQIRNIEVLENPQKLHTEHLMSQRVGADCYIGIAKLSCGYCDKVLGPETLNHRGTHGVVDDAWLPDDLRHQLDATLVKREDRLRPQHRALSFDETLERQIVVPESFGHHVTLAELKVGLHVVAPALLPRDPPTPPQEPAAAVAAVGNATRDALSPPVAQTREPEQAQAIAEPQQQHRSTLRRSASFRDALSHPIELPPPRAQEPAPEQNQAQGQQRPGRRNPPGANKCCVIL